MKTTSMSTKFAGLLFAAIATVAVLGGTAGAMQASADDVTGPVVTLERLVVVAEPQAPTAVN